VKKKDIDKWNDYLIKKGVKRSVKKESNLVLIPVEQDFYFNFGKVEKGFKIAPIGLILSDLDSFGGLGKEQKKIIEEQWLKT